MTNPLKDLAAARRRLIWSWHRDGVGISQIVAKISKVKFDKTYVESVLMTPENHPSYGDSVYTELEDVKTALSMSEKDLKELRYQHESLSLVLEDAKSAREKAELEAKEEHEISRACVNEAARHIAMTKELRDQLTAARAHNGDLVDRIEKLEGKLEKYEDSEGKPLRRGKLSKNEFAVSDLEKRVIDLEEEIEDRLSDLTGQIDKLQDAVDGLKDE